MPPIIQTFFIALSLASVFSYAPVLDAAVPFWGAKASLPADTPTNQLQHGEFIWMGEAVTSGPVVMVVSLVEQKAYVYRNGVLIGVTTVSTGRPGFETPTGVFTILQKDKDHRSTIYNSAPMPYMQRLTWGGIALHAGGLPGYPESHGCVHLPSELARQLYDISPPGMTVVVASEASEPRTVTHPGYLAPVSPASGKPTGESALSQTESQRWQPELSASGPVSIVLSRQSRRVVVYRNGVEIGRSRLIVRGDEPIGTHALVLAEGPGHAGDRFVPDPSKLRWLRIGVPGHMGESGTEVDPAAIDRVDIPDAFVNEVYAVLVPGTTVLATDAALSPATTGSTLDIVNADPPLRKQHASRQQDKCRLQRLLRQQLMHRRAASAESNRRIDTESGENFFY